MRNLKFVTVVASLALLVVWYFESAHTVQSSLSSIDSVIDHTCELDCDSHFACVVVDPHPSTCTMVRPFRF